MKKQKEKTAMSRYASENIVFQHTNIKQKNKKGIKKMHTKEFYDWIKTELKIVPEADTVVLDFIYRFRTYLNGVNNLAESILISQFKKGYCYHFAAILQSTFQRGEVCWMAPYGHMVWVDDNHIAYDISGIVKIKNEELIPDYMMGNVLRDFVHIPGDLSEITDTDEKNIIQEWKIVKDDSFSLHGKNVTELTKEEAKEYLQYPFVIQDDFRITWNFGLKTTYLKRKFNLES